MASGFSAVPVLPASLYPATCASGAVPSGPSTPSSIVDTSSAVRRESTRLPGRRSPARMYGRRITPPFAIAVYAAAICIGVTARPCPIGRLPIEEPE